LPEAVFFPASCCRPAAGAGDPQDLLVLSTYLFKLTNKLGVPSYQLMAVVVVAIIAITAPQITHAATPSGATFCFAAAKV
jgi:hypothetical protein